MQFGGRVSLRWLLGWGALALAGAIVIVRADISQRRETFQTDACIAHRLLSQRAVQHEAILATLVLLNPAIDARSQDERHLPAMYPQVQSVLRRDLDDVWPDDTLRFAEARSRQSRQAALGSVDAAANRYTLVHSGRPTSFALRIDVQRMGRAWCGN